MSYVLQSTFAAERNEAFQERITPINGIQMERSLSLVRG